MPSRHKALVWQVRTGKQSERVDLTVSSSTSGVFSGGSTGEEKWPRGCCQPRFRWVKTISFLSCLQTPEGVNLFHSFLNFSGLQNPRRNRSCERWGHITPEGRFFLSPLISFIANGQELLPSLTLTFWADIRLSGCYLAPWFLHSLGEDFKKTHRASASKVLLERELNFTDRVAVREVGVSYSF